jgi:2'-5' RNA ligase
VTGTSPARRLFFAFWPEPPVRAAIAEYSTVLRVGTGARPVAARDLHVTLEFLGLVQDADARRLEALCPLMRLPPLTLSFDRLAFWPGVRSLVLESSSPPPALLAAQAALRADLRDLGVRVGTRDYRPHVTLWRGLPSAFDSPVQPPLEWPLTEVALVRSEPGPAGSDYAVERRWRRSASGDQFIPD